MSKLKIPYQWGPRCWFFDEAMAAHKFSGTEHALLYVVQRLTFDEPDYTRPGSRKESACISLDEFRRRTGRAISAIRKALSALEEADVLIVVARAHGETATEYGINARIDEWKVPRIGQVDETEYPGQGCLQRGTHEPSKRGTPGAKKRHPWSEKEAPLDAKRGTPAASQPSNRKASQPAKEILRDKEKERSPIIPKGDDTNFSSSLRILSPEEALSDRAMSRSLALDQADLAYRETGWDLTRRESKQLEKFFELSPFKGTLLYFWLLALRQTSEDRLERLEDASRYGYISGSPFKRAMQNARDRYGKAKKAKLAKTAAEPSAEVSSPPAHRPPISEPDPSTRLTTADDPKSNPGAAA